MRPIEPELAAHLRGETTTYCYCWRVTRRDGVVLGFTDHDCDIVFEETTFQASSGLDATEMKTGAGFATGGGDVAGALDADSLKEADLAAGLWDNDRVEMFLLNWQVPEQRIRLSVAHVGEVSRQGVTFTAELRSMMHLLDARKGRLYTATCDAAFGDKWCGIDLEDSRYRAEGVTTNAIGRFEIAASGLDAFESDLFRGGLLTWRTGTNIGLSFELRDYRLENGIAQLCFWQKLPFAAEHGDRFTITAGCDKTHAMCRDRFANIRNFRGFPHMPGTDRALSYAGTQPGPLDGGSLFR